MKFKKIMAMVLALCMVLSTMSFNVFAADEDSNVITVDSQEMFQAALDEAQDGSDKACETLVTISDEVGTGTEEDPYLINNVDDLIEFRDSVNAGETRYNAPGVWVALGADIDMADTVWTEGIGDGTNATFDGNFDGNNYTIKNFIMNPTVDADNYLCGGLFGYIYGNVQIKDLVFENVTITSEDEGHNVGVLVGFANNNGGKAQISNVTVKGDINIDTPNVYGVGAIVGYSYRDMGTIADCKVEANDGSYINGYSFVGGITGYSYSNAVISGCAVSGVAINATNYSVGGIAGIVLSGNKISDCTVDSSVEVSGQANVGSVVGALSADTVIIEDCVAAAPMVGGNYSDNKPFVAGIGNKYFTSLANAVEEAEAGDTIKLLDDIKITGKFVFNKAVTIDGNGHSIIADENAVWYTVSGKLNIKNYKTHLIGVNSDNVILKNIVLDNNNNAAGINIYCAQNVVFDNISITNATKGVAALTVNGSTLTIKNKFEALGNAIAIDISNGSGVTSNLGVTVEDGTVFDLGNKTVKFASVANLDMSGAKKTDGTPYFAAMDNAYYYTVTQMESRTGAFGNGLTLLSDIELSKDISVKGTLDTNGHTLTIADGKVLKVEGNLTVLGSGTINTEFKLTKATSTITGPEGLNVMTDLEGYFVKYANGDGKYSVEEAVAAIGTTQYASLKDAFEAAQDSDTIKLVKNIVLNETLTNTKKITLDLAGHTISQTKECTESYEMIANNGTLTINDSVGGGKISFKDTGAGDPNATWGSYTIRNSGNLIINDCTIENLSAQNTVGQPMAHCTLALFQYSGNTTINNATISNPNYRSIRLWNGNMTINGGNFVGQVWVQNDGVSNATSSLTINGGSFAPSWNDGSSVFVGYGAQGSSTALSITDGYFATKVGCTNNAAGAGLTGGITGGTFAAAAVTASTEALCNNLGYKLVENADGTYGVEATTLRGSGTEEDPYIIENLSTLKLFRDTVNNGNNYAGKYVKLNDDIDLSSVDNWTPIGDTVYNNKYAPADPSKAFSGVFDGNGKVISNLKIEKNIGEGPDGISNTGLFGIIGEGAVIKDLTITNVDINTDGRNVGALAGVAYKATLENITINGNIQISGGNNVSGVCAMTRYYNMSATDITVCGEDGSSINGNNIVGGIFAEIAPGSSTQTFENLSVENVAINGVGGVGGIVGLLTDGAVSKVSVKNVELVGNTAWPAGGEDRIRIGSIAGLLGSTSATISNVTVENVTAKNLEGKDVVLPVIGANYDASSNATEARIGDKYYATFAKAVAAAKDGDTITLVSGDGVISAAASVTGGKTITITGDAIVDWTKGNLMIGRGGEGDGKVIFKNANIKSAKKVTTASTGFHVSAKDKDTSTTNVGTLEIIDSYIEVDYLIQRNYTKIDNSEVVVYGGTYIHGRPADETPDGVDGTATMDVVNGSTLRVVNPNGQGVGGEGNGVLNIVDSTLISETAAFPVNAKGTLNSNGSILKNGLAVKDGATVSITAGTYSFDPTEYLADNLYAVKSKNTGLYTVTGKRKVNLVANGIADTTDNKGIVVKTGEEFTVDVKVSGIEAGGVKWIIDYDEEKFTLESADFKGNRISQNNNDVDIDMYGTLEDGEVVATYTFKALNDAVENSPFALTYAELLTVDEAWQEMDVTNITDGVNTEVTIELRKINYTVKFDGEETTSETAQFNYTGDPHTFEVDVTVPSDATIAYTLNGNAAAIEDLSITAEGVWEIGYSITKDGYAEESGMFTLTISKPDYKVEVDVSESGDFVSGYKLVLVYTNAKAVAFDFDGVQMLDASDSQYKYNNTDEYDNVFALVVKGLGEGSTFEDYEELVTVDYTGDSTPIDYSVANDVNFSTTVNFNDIVSAYSVLEINKNAFENYMAGVIKTDVNFSKNATDMDITPIIAEVYGINEN